MHDPLNIDQRFRLILTDHLNDFPVFLIIHVGVADPEFIDAESDINLAERVLRQYLFYSGVLSLSVIVCEPQFLVKNVVDIDGFLRKERGAAFKASVFAKSDCPGIPDEQCVAEVCGVY